jgi:hypothetical protein
LDSAGGCAFFFAVAVTVITTADGSFAADALFEAALKAKGINDAATSAPSRSDPLRYMFLFINCTPSFHPIQLDAGYGRNAYMKKSEI